MDFFPCKKRNTSSPFKKISSWYYLLGYHGKKMKKIIFCWFFKSGGDTLRAEHLIGSALGRCLF
jgi:hypothetical protein